MERTDHTEMDALLRRILTEPSHAARLFTETAARLEAGYPFLVLTEDQLNQAAKAATRSVLADLPDVVAAEAIERARHAGPPVRNDQHETGGDFAARLRAAAESL